MDKVIVYSILGGRLDTSDPGNVVINTTYTLEKADWLQIHCGMENCAWTGKDILDGVVQTVHIRNEDIALLFKLSFDI
jgi:hypothetical protein